MTDVAELAQAAITVSTTYPRMAAGACGCKFACAP